MRRDHLPGEQVRADVACTSEAAIAPLELRRLAEQRAVRARTHSATQSMQRRRGHRAAAANSRAAMRSVSLEQRVRRASAFTKRGSRPSRCADAPARRRARESRSGPVTLTTNGGDAACARHSSAMRVRVALPDRVHVAHREVDRLAVAHARSRCRRARRSGGRPRSSGARSPPACRCATRRVLEHALASEARRGVLADRCRRVDLARSRTVDRARAGRRCRWRTRRCAPARSARRTCAGTSVFIAQVSDGALAVPNFCPAMKMTFAASGSAGDDARVEQVGARRSRRRRLLQRLRRAAARRSATRR